jgi:phospholipase D1/2
VLCPRNPDQGRSYVQEAETAAMFTHHQKTVVVDGGVADVNAPPRFMSFLGGIDLCDGRYDTQDHPLFRTLGTTHRADFHQPNFPGASIAKGGPREPWHDIHCRVEGPAAWDVLENFEQRWRKQGDGDNFLVALQKAWALREAAAASEDSWNVQVFRSIDGGAAEGFPEKPDEAAALGLVSGKDHVIAASRTRTSTPSGARGTSCTSRTNTFWGAPTRGDRTTALRWRASTRCASFPRSCRSRS